MLKRLFIVSLVLLGVTPGCKKQQYNNGVPNVAVNIYIPDINNALYAKVTVTGGWMYVTGGYDGIILYRNTPATFLAYDMCCPYDGAVNSKAIVQVQSNNISAVCPVCGSSFLLSDGAPYSGPASQELKQYDANFDVPPSLTVTNY